MRFSKRVTQFTYIGHNKGLQFQVENPQALCSQTNIQDFQPGNLVIRSE